MATLGSLMDAMTGGSEEPKTTAEKAEKIRSELSLCPRVEDFPDDFVEHLEKNNKDLYDKLMKLDESYGVWPETVTEFNNALGDYLNKPVDQDKLAKVLRGNHWFPNRERIEAAIDNKKKLTPKDLLDADEASSERVESIKQVTENLAYYFPDLYVPEEALNSFKKKYPDKFKDLAYHLDGWDFNPTSGSWDLNPMRNPREAAAAFNAIRINYIQETYVNSGEKSLAVIERKFGDKIPGLQRTTADLRSEFNSLMAENIGVKATETSLKNLKDLVVDLNEFAEKEKERPKPTPGEGDAGEPTAPAEETPTAPAEGATEQKEVAPDSLQGRFESSKKEMAEWKVKFDAYLANPPQDMKGRREAFMALYKEFSDKKEVYLALQKDVDTTTENAMKGGLTDEQMPEELKTLVSEIRKFNEYVGKKLEIPLKREMNKISPAGWDDLREEMGLKPVVERVSKDADEANALMDQMGIEFQGNRLVFTKAGKSSEIKSIGFTGAEKVEIKVKGKDKLKIKVKGLDGKNYTFKGKTWKEIEEDIDKSDYPFGRRKVLVGGGVESNDGEEVEAPAAETPAEASTEPVAVTATPEATKVEESAFEDVPDEEFKMDDGPAAPSDTFVDADEEKIGTPTGIEEQGETLSRKAKRQAKKEAKKNEESPWTKIADSVDAADLPEAEDDEATGTDTPTT